MSHDCYAGFKGSDDYKKHCEPVELDCTNCTPQKAGALLKSMKCKHDWTKSLVLFPTRIKHTCSKCNLRRYET